MHILRFEPDKIKKEIFSTSYQQQPFYLIAV